MKTLPALMVVAILPETNRTALGLSPTAHSKTAITLSTNEIKRYYMKFVHVLVDAAS